MKKKNLTASGSFDSLYNLVCGLFNKVPDNREQNASYRLSDMLKIGFAMFSLKSPSLLNFITQTKAEQSNLKSIYKIKAVPSENGLRKGLDKVSIDFLSEGFRKLWGRLKSLGILDKYRYYGRHLIISVDGVEHFCSKNIRCRYCMERKQGKKSKGYFHSMLSAVLVHPQESEVFVVDNEPILREDGSRKNDCERNAGKRLLKRLREIYQKEKLLFVMDALYSCGPIIREIMAGKIWQYVINIKPEGNSSLFSQFESREKRGLVKWTEIKEGNLLHRFGYTNNLALNSSNSEIRVNMLYYQQIADDGKKVVFSWVTSIPLTKANVYKVMRMGRSRWKIENETFNTLKNQGYNFEHNYGHGKNNLCSVFALLMMLAFTVDQIQQHACTYFKKLRIKLKTKAKLWENIRAAFKIMRFNSMEKLFFKIAELNVIQLE